MQRKEIKPEEAMAGDKVSIEMNKGADRDGVVSENNVEQRTLELTGDNFVKIKVGYDKIDVIEKLVD